MQRYQTEDERRKAMRARINKTIKRGKRRKRIIRRLKKAVPGICIGVLIAGMGAWCIAAPLPDPDDYEPYDCLAGLGTTTGDVQEFQAAGMRLDSIPQESIIIVALLHDLCKVNFYATEMRWRTAKR